METQALGLRMWDRISLSLPDRLFALLSRHKDHETAPSDATGRDATAVDFLEIAEDILESGDREAASAYCTKAIEASGGRHQRHQRALAYATRGSINLTLGDQETALSDFNAALRINRRDATTLINRANAYGIMGDYARARRDIRKAIDLAPKNSKAYQIQGRVLAQLDKLRPAIKSLTRAIRLDPANPENYIARALVHQKRGKHKRALKDFTSALEINPLAETAYRNRAESFRALNDERAAREDDREATQLSRDKTEDTKAPSSAPADVHVLALAAARKNQ